VGLNPLKDLKPRHLVGVFYLNFFLSGDFRIFTYMKKYTLIMAIGVVSTLMSCGSGSTTKESTDSLAAQVDTAAVSATDSTTAQIPTVEAGTVKEDAEKPVSNEAVK
jgi:hypothetical protein